MTAFGSMPHKGNCLDNAVTASFFPTLKRHVVHENIFSTIKKRMLFCLRILRFTTIELEDIL